MNHSTLFSFLWIIVHIYVLTQIKDDGDLRMQRFAKILHFLFIIWTCWLSCSRYLDILMGLSMLVSLVSLEYGSMSGEKAPLALFLILRFIHFWLHLHIPLHEHVHFWLLQTINRIVVLGWTLCDSHLFRLYFGIFNLQRCLLLTTTYLNTLCSLATIAGYWLWFLYLKYLKMENEASKEV